MGPQTRIGCAAKLVDEIDLVCIEETVLQANIPAIAQRCANAGNCLPCKTGVRIIKIRTGKDIRHFGPGNADTAADKSLNTIIVTKVEHAVQHEAERIDFAIDVERSGSSGAATRKLRHTWRTGLELVGRCGFITDFGFQTETSEIITDDAVKIITHVMIDFKGTIGAANINRQIFGDQYTALDADIPLVITCQCRCG